MKLFYHGAGTRVVVINGEKVKFVNCIAEVEDKFGEDALKLGLPNLFEEGKQPAFQTPREVALQSDAKDREDFYKKELERLTNIKTALEEQVKQMQKDVAAWKAEYQKEHDLRVKEVGTGGVQQNAPVVTEQPAPELTEEEKLRAELELMTKVQIMDFAKEAAIDMTSIAAGKKQDMIDFIIEQSKGE